MKTYFICIFCMIIGTSQQFLAPANIQPTSCYLCSGPPFLCEQFFHVQTCADNTQQYCINHLINNRDGSRALDRRCATLDECREKWWQQTSDRSECVNFDVNSANTHAFTCDFCCVGPLCNKPVIPNKLYKPSSQQVTSTPTTKVQSTITTTATNTTIPKVITTDTSTKTTIPKVITTKTATKTTIPKVITTKTATKTTIPKVITTTTATKTTIPKVPNHTTVSTKSTVQISTSKQLLPTSNIKPTKCYLCSGPPFICEHRYHEAVCSSSSQQYCMNQMVNKKDGTRTLNRTCATLDECKQKWWNETSGRDICVNYDVNTAYDHQFTCDFCCVGPLCNQHVIPDNLYQPSGQQVTVKPRPTIQSVTKAIKATIPTTSSPSTVVQKATVQISSGLKCLHCNDVTNITECLGIIVTCGQNEQCFLEKVTTDLNNIVFNGGCRSNQVCQVMQTLAGALGKRSLDRYSRAIVTCAECCNSLPDSDGPCNAKLCGKIISHTVTIPPTISSSAKTTTTKLQSNTGAGVTCAYCDSVPNISECRASTMTCGPGEQCFLEQVITGAGQVLYNGGCRSDRVCQIMQQLYNTSGKRSLDRYSRELRCAKCCNSSPDNDGPCNVKLCGNSVSQAPTVTPTFSVQNTTSQLKSNTSCYLCSGAPFICESLYRPQQCSSADQQYCVTKFVNNVNGTRSVYRTCATRDECQKVRWKNNVNMMECAQFNPNRPDLAKFSCSYCCASSLCNKNIIPDRLDLLPDNFDQTAITSSSPVATTNMTMSTRQASSSTKPTILTTDTTTPFTKTTTPSTKTTTPSTNTHLTTSTKITSQNKKSDISNGTLCFHCDHLSDPRQCRTVDTCSGSELCALREKHDLHQNTKTYKQFCITKYMCDLRKRSVRDINRFRYSFDCCNTTLCNTFTDTQAGQGQTCYKCDHLSDPRRCRTIDYCSEKEVCGLRERHDLQQSTKTYNQFCISNDLCDFESRKRSIRDLSWLRFSYDCCNTTLCNTFNNSIVTGSSSVIQTVTSSDTTGPMTAGTTKTTGPMTTVIPKADQLKLTSTVPSVMVSTRTSKIYQPTSAYTLPAKGVSAGTTKNLTLPPTLPSIPMSTQQYISSRGYSYTVNSGIIQTITSSDTTGPMTAGTTKTTGPMTTVIPKVDQLKLTSTLPSVMVSTRTSKTYQTSAYTLPSKGVSVQTKKNPTSPPTLPSIPMSTQYISSRGYSYIADSTTHGVTVTCKPMFCVLNCGNPPTYKQDQNGCPRCECAAIG